MGPRAASIAATAASACSLLVACGDSRGAPATADAGALTDASFDTADGFDEASSDARVIDPIPWKSGARLRAKIMDGGGGAKLFDVWQDVTLRFDCSFAVASDGRVRCLPIDEDLPVITSFFADAACTKNVAIGPAAEQPYVRIVENRCGRSEDDPKPLRVVRWGGVVNVDVPYIVKSGICSPIANAPDFTWYAIGDADPLQFVAATEQLHVATDGSGVRILLGEDGSRENSRLIDPATATACDVVSDHVLGGPDLCVPTPFAAGPALPFYGSDSCSETIAFAESGCDHARAGLMMRRTDCVFGVDVVELGASFATDSTKIFRRYQDGVCQSEALANPMTAYRTGPPFAPRAFAAPPSLSFGTGRLVSRLHASSDGVVVRNARLMPIRYQLDPDSPIPVLQPAPFEFYDQVLMTRCRVEKAADGNWRCIPTSTVPKLGEYFEDEACTVAAHLGLNDPGCLVSGYVSIPGWLEVGLGLRPTSEIRAIGAVLQKPMYMYAPFPIDPSDPPRGTCVPAPAEPGRVFYALGPSISVNELASVANRIE